MLKTFDDRLALCHHFVTFLCRSDVYIDRFYSFGRGPTCGGSGNGVTAAGLSNTK